MVTFKEQLQSLPSVAGIVNTAMVLKDELVKDLSFESFAEGMAPKIKGNLKKVSPFNCNYICTDKYVCG